MITNRRYIVIAALIGALMCASAIAASAGPAPQISQSGGAVCTNLSTPVIALYGYGAAPGCPAGWSTLVTETAAGTMAPVTAITTASANRLTALTTTTPTLASAITTTSIAPLTSGSFSFGARTIETWTGLLIMPQATGANGTTSGSVLSSGSGSVSATSYTVANGGTTTTPTLASAPTFTNTTYTTGGTTTTYTLYYRVCQAP